MKIKSLTAISISTAIFSMPYPSIAVESNSNHLKNFIDQVNRGYISSRIIDQESLNGLNLKIFIEIRNSVPKRILNLENINSHFDRLLIAQSSLPQRIQKSYARIIEFAIDLAQRFGPDDMRWNDADVEFIEDQGVLNVTLYGKAPALIGDRDVRLQIPFQTENRLNFVYSGNFNFRVSRCGKLRPICRRRRRRAARQIEEILMSNRTLIEAAINKEAQQLLSDL